MSICGVPENPDNPLPISKLRSPRQRLAQCGNRAEGNLRCILYRQYHTGYQARSPGTILIECIVRPADLRQNTDQSRHHRGLELPGAARKRTACARKTCTSISGDINTTPPILFKVCCCPPIVIWRSACINRCAPIEWALHTLRRTPAVSSCCNRVSNLSRANSALARSQAYPKGGASVCHEQ